MTLVPYVTVALVFLTAGAGAACDFTAQGIIDMLSLHNTERRATLVPPLQALGDVLWDTALQRSAQAFADTCPPDTSRNSPASAREVTSNCTGTLWSPSGENTVVAGSLLGAFMAFSSSKLSYNVTTNTCSTCKSCCSQYTQLIWSSTRYIGCGCKSCSFGNFYVCQYGEAGNTNGLAPYVPCTSSSCTPSQPSAAACSAQATSITKCGNGVLDTSSNEQCDGILLNGQTCFTLGFSRGVLSCAPTCFFDVSKCFLDPGPVCGNGKVDVGEYCDGNPPPETCTTLGYYGGGLACTPVCRFDTSACVTGARPAQCGNGILNINEECDGALFRGVTCETLGMSTGVLQCLADCRVSLALCGPRVVSACGNGALDLPAEQCDGTFSDTCTSLGYATGLLSCQNCKFNTSQCRAAAPLYCNPNGILEYGEECDGSASLATCSQRGFASGDAKCEPNCRINLSGCVKAALAPVSPGVKAVGCGNGAVDPGTPEQCDWTVGTETCASLGYTGGLLSCTTSCYFDLSKCVLGAIPATCGDGQLNPTEECDGPLRRGETCASVGFALGGSLKCLPNCRLSTEPCFRPAAPVTPLAPVCGNSIVNDGEACDGTNLNGQSCVILGRGMGVLLCSAACGFDFSQCQLGPPTTKCGDGVVNNGEACDGALMNGASCPQLGSVFCSPQCTVNSSQCYTAGGPSACGNSFIEAGESCDRGNLGTATCRALGFGGGTLACTSSCAYDLSGCTGSTKCGDGNIDSGEQCDGTNVNGLTCQAFGFSSGVLQCSACAIVTSSCVGAKCGNGILDSGEQCDRAAFVSGVSCTALGYGSGLLGCTPNCTVDTSPCVRPAAPILPPGTCLTSSMCKNSPCATVPCLSGKVCGNISVFKVDKSVCNVGLLQGVCTAGVCTNEVACIEKCNLMTSPSPCLQYTCDPVVQKCQLVPTRSGVSCFSNGTMGACAAGTCYASMPCATGCPLGECQTTYSCNQTTQQCIFSSRPDFAQCTGGVCYRGRCVDQGFALFAAGLDADSFTVQGSSPNLFLTLPSAVKTDESNSSGVVAAAVIVPLAVLFLIVGLFVFFRMRRKLPPNFTYPSAELYKTGPWTYGPESYVIAKGSHEGFGEQENQEDPYCGVHESTGDVIIEYQPASDPHMQFTPNTAHYNPTVMTHFTPMDEPGVVFYPQSVMSYASH